MHPATSSCRCIIVIVPPDGVQHADQPEPSEEQGEEQDDAGGRCGVKSFVSSMKKLLANLTYSNSILVISFNALKSKKKKICIHFY